MKCPRTIPFLQSGLALGAKRHEGFADAWNWLIHSFWHMTLGCGLKWANKWQGYPKIELLIEAGEGIDVKYDDGKVIISLGDGNTEDEEEEDGGGSEGPGKDLEEEQSEDGDITGGGGSGEGDGVGGGSSGGGGGTSCNEFSMEPDNEDGDPGLENLGDS